MRYAVEDARTAGFSVGEDLSVTDRMNSATAAVRAARQAQAQAFAGDIRQRATQLVGLDQQVAGRITTAMSGVAGVGFPEAPAGNDAVPLDNRFRTGPEFGTGDIDDVDRKNRAVLDELEREYSKLPDGQIKTDRLADIAAIREALKVPDSHLLFIEKPSDPSQMIPAATAIGDPFNADHVSVTVPGVSGTTRQTIVNMTREASGLRLEARDIARKVGASQNISTIAWVGYQPPAVIVSKDTPFDDLAHAGAPKLESFLQNLDAASHSPGHTIALFGHSYGSLVSGIALKDGVSSVVDNAVMYGSPGFEATSPAKLGMNDHNFFVMSAPDDPIRPIGALAMLHGWGSDPNEIIYEDTTPGSAG
ncbi:MAG TPA: alpha/beta hydrolase family protein, partial [Mycobacterium sp.]|nr:alpha/beta hydrolase family protein [Mycobacterium sp.]